MLLVVMLVNRSSYGSCDTTSHVVVVMVHCAVQFSIRLFVGFLLLASRSKLQGKLLIKYSRVGSAAGCHNRSSYPIVFLPYQQMLLERQFVTNDPVLLHSIQILGSRRFASPTLTSVAVRIELICCVSVSLITFGMPGMDYEWTVILDNDTNCHFNVWVRACWRLDKHKRSAVTIWSRQVRQLLRFPAVTNKDVRQMVILRQY